MMPIVDRTKLLFGAKSGAAAIEFAILAPLTFVIIFAVFETGWIMAQTIMLDHGLAVASRAIQLQDRSISYDDYRERICQEAVILPDCSHALRLELTPITRASDLPSVDTPCVDRRIKIAPAVAYNPGQRSQLVLSRACLVVDPLLPSFGLGLNLPKDGSGGLRLISKTAFVNEPGA